jgi:hypothetical protein
LLRQVTRSTLFAVAFLGVAFGNSGLSLAAGAPSVSVEGKADLIAPTMIAIVVDANCAAGSSAGQIFATASQSSAIGDATGFGDAAFVSDGSRQKVVVFINGGPWNVGPASATAQLVCGNQFAGEDLGARITIQ